MIIDCIKTTFVAVQCKKPWNYLALTIFRASALVVLVLADSVQLTFNKASYRQQFGSGMGESLYIKIADELKACPDSSVTFQAIQMGICTVIWKLFGVKWLEIFSCIKVSRKTTPEQGADYLVVLSSTLRMIQTSA